MDHVQQTGERFGPGSSDFRTAYEHVHRYLYALQLVAGLRVLDAACGEGYGTAMLARIAKQVVGLDRAIEAVRHARQTYRRPNIQFFQADCERLGLAPGSFDAVVSFETLEHLDQQGAFLSAIKSCLAENGFLLISTPNRRLYSDVTGYHNPFHRRELYFQEFSTLLRQHFGHVTFLGQTLTQNSLIAPITDPNHMHEQLTAHLSITEIGPDVVEYPLTVSSTLQPRYFMALCSDQPQSVLQADILFDNLRSMEAAAEAQLTMLTRALQENEVSHRQLTVQLQSLQSELAQYMGQVAEQDRRLAELMLATDQRERTLAEYADYLAASTTQVWRLEQSLSDQQRTLSEVQNQLAVRTAPAAAVRQELDGLRRQSALDQIEKRYLSARAQAAFAAYSLLKNRLFVRLFEQYVSPLKEGLAFPWRGKPLFRRRQATTPLRSHLETDLSQALGVGRGAVLALRGWCYHPEYQLDRLEILVDGRPYPVDSHSGLRKDVMYSHVPALDCSGNSLNSEFIGFVPIAPIQERCCAELTLRAYLSNRQPLEALLGHLELLPGLADVEKPADSTPRLVICMATYNPPLDLFAEQINSLRDQTFTDWLCIVNDDCSQPELLAEMEHLLDGDLRFIIYRNPSRLGFYHNFERCLMRVPSGVEFIALADQDDRWYPDKIEATLAAFAPGVTLVYCDQHIVARDGGLISPTYWTERSNNYADLAAMLMANTVTGAASIFRASLLDKILPFPVRHWELYHDGWIACVALAAGRIEYVDRPLYAYRQHSGNVVGHTMPRLTRFPTFHQALRWALAPVGEWQRLYSVLIQDYGLYWELAACWSFLARLLLLRLPDVTANKRKTLQELAQLCVSLRVWFQQVMYYRSKQNLTLGCELLGMRSFIGKWVVDSSHRRHRARFVQAYLDSILVVADQVEIQPKPDEPVVDRKPGVGQMITPEAEPETIDNAGVLRPLQTICRPLTLLADSGARRRVNVLMSTIDFRYVFGGYIGMFNLALELDRAGYRVRLVLTEETAYNPEVWRQEFTQIPGLVDILDRIEIALCNVRSISLVVNPNDWFIATSWWTAHVVHQAVRELKRDRFIYFIQEYEPAFQAQGSVYAYAQESYTFPHFAIFSSGFLQEYFKIHSIGVFAAGEAVGDRDSIAIRNAITRQPVTPDRLRRLPGARGRLLFYARPEEHAQRNMFELGILGLSAAFEQGILAPDRWELYGIGSLGGAKRLRLAESVFMNLQPKTNFQDYHQQLASYDLGISLMLSPHPSLVPLDMAAAGIVTLTNTFENKTAEKLSIISSNLIGVPATVMGIQNGIAAALERIDDYEGRASGADIHWPATWKETFDGPVGMRIRQFIERLN